jgi:signal transduction histidine kinase
MGRRSVVFDTVLTAVVLAAGQAEAWTGAQATHRQGPHWAQALGYGLAAVALLIRRVRPLRCVLLVCGVLVLEFAVFGSPEGMALAVIPTVAASPYRARVRPLRCVLLVCGVLVLEFAVFGSPEGMALAVIPTVAAYTVANREDRTRALYGLAALAALGVAWLAFDPLTVTPVQYVQGSVWLSIWLIAWLLGAYLRTRRLYAAGLVRERRERELTAVAEERNRIARELHDVVGHSVSVMTVQASAVRRLMRPDQTKERAALETVEAAGREALTEMRRMVGVLRSGDAAPNLAPPPTLDQLGSLADDFRRAGLDVVVESDGEPVPLPPGLDLTAYRLVQEALTNTLRHAEATRVAVCVRYGKDALLIAVRDDGRGPNGSPAGTGLLGMRERVYGGSLSTGAAEGGGFELRAELPLEGT